MSSNLATLTAKLQAQLLDNGTLFNAATCTVAFREALRKWNMTAPIHAGTIIDVVPAQFEYMLNDATFGTILDIESVWQQDPIVNGENDVALIYDFYFENNQPAIRLRSALAGGHLIVRYTTPHTVSGLDNATGGLLNDDQEQVLIDGACVEAINIRTASLVEGYNLSPNVIEQYKCAAAAYVQAFAAGLQRYARQRPAVGGHISASRAGDLSFRALFQVEGLSKWHPAKYARCAQVQADRHSPDGHHTRDRGCQQCPREREDRARTGHCFQWRELCAR
jgi:hypothetical protein